MSQLLIPQTIVAFAWALTQGLGYGMDEDFKYRLIVDLVRISAVIQTTTLTLSYPLYNTSFIVRITD